MITILKQQKKLFMNLIMNGFTPESSENPGAAEIDKPKENESLKEKKEKIIKFINDPSNSFSKDNYFYIQYLKGNTDEIDTIINQEFQGDEGLMINEFTIETIVGFLKGKNEIEEKVKEEKTKLKNEILGNTEISDTNIKQNIYELTPVYFIRGLYIKKGTIYKGKDVKELQNFLKLKYNLKDDFCDGVYGTKTQEYVDEYIQKNNIKFNKKSNPKTHPYNYYWEPVYKSIIKEITESKNKHYLDKIESEKQKSKKSIDVRRKTVYKTRKEYRLEEEKSKKSKKEEELRIKQEKETNSKKEYIEFFNKIVLDEKYKKIDKGGLKEELLKTTPEKLKELDKNFDNLIEEDDKWFVDKEKELIDLVKKELPGYKKDQEITKKEVIEISDIVKKLARGPAIERKVKANIGKEINYDSLSKIIEKYDKTKLESIYTFFIEVEKYNNDHKGEKIPYGKSYEYIFNNYLKGYDEKGFTLDKEEIEQIKNFIKSKIDISESLYFNIEEKKKVLFDYNDDYKLDNKGEFYTYEREIYEAIDTEEEFDNLLKNLGYTDLPTFKKDIINKTDKTKKQFKDRLGILISSNVGFNPGLLLSDPKAIENYLNEKEKITKKAKDDFDKETDKSNNKDLKEIKEKDKAFYEKIKLEAVGFLLSNERIGAGVSFNIQEITRYVDSLQLGVINGVPGIGLSKNLYGGDESGKRVRVDAGFINFIPYLSATVKLKDGKVKVEKLLQEEVKLGLTIKATGTISLKTGFAGLEFLRVDETQKEGIDKLKKEMREKIKEAFIDIENNKDVKNTKYNNNPEEKESYELLKSLYISYGKGEKAKKVIIEGTINNYERHLFENNVKKGITFQGIGAGIAIISKLAFPVIVIDLQKAKMSWKEVKREEEKPKETLADKVDLSTEKPKKKEYIDTEIEGLEVRIKEIEKNFSYETRHIKGSLALMNPNNDLGTRWNGLIELSGNKSDLGLSEIISGVESIKGEKQVYEKWYVISTVSQYMKKAHDYNNGDITSWNIKEKINIDRGRREKFNMIFGFDASYYAELYNEELLNANKNDLSKRVEKGVGFDATSSINVEKNRTVRGIDVFYSNLQVITVNDKPLLIKIDKDDMTKFVSKINEKTNILPEIKQLITEGLNNGVLELYYYRDANGFDDRLMLKLSEKAKTIKNIRTLFPASRYIKLFGAFMGEAINPEEKPKITGRSDSTTGTSGDGQTNNGTLLNAGGGMGETTSRDSFY